MSDDQAPNNLELVRRSIDATLQVVLGRGLPDPSRTPSMDPVPVDDGDEAAPNGSDVTYYGALGKLTQAVAQTTAIAIQDGADMLRNVSTIEVTTIGAATAAFFATQNPLYLSLIETSLQTINQASQTYVSIGEAAFKVFSQFKST